MENHEIFLKNKFKQISSLISEKSRVLDVGCNDGKIRHFLKNCDYNGVDIDKSLIFNLSKEGIKAKRVNLNEDKLPFKDKDFDYVLLLDILEHVVNPKKLLTQSKMKLKKGGKIITTLPNDYHILNKLRFVMNKHLTQDPFAPYGHLHYFPIKTGELFLSQNGFRISKKIIIPPTKPSFLPQSIKNFLAKRFPQEFARDILYVLDIL